MHLKYASRSLFDQGPVRIAIVNWSLRCVGGVETYISCLLPALVSNGHDVSLLGEIDEPGDRRRISRADEIPVWCVIDGGIDRAIASLWAWKPDILYVQSDIDPELEQQLIGIAPSVYFAHNYTGACISGSKLQRLPSMTVCERTLGWRCLLHYYPRRCGGLNPITMWTNYANQTQRAARLHRYDAIVTASAHMKSEYVRQGFDPDRVHVVWLPIVTPTSHEPSATDHDSSPRINRSTAWESELRLLFVGRMEWIKGGHILIDALPEISALLARRVSLNFVGDGRERERWSRRAQSVQSSDGRVHVDFDGWLDGAPLAERFKQADLLVVPSLWPEPFGMVGPEAARYGLPAVAFDVGGISDWLTDGVNGHLAPTNPTTASGLARAVVGASNEREHYLNLCEGARRAVVRFGLDAHTSSLMELCGEIVTSKAV